MLPAYAGGGLNSHRSPAATVNREETCHVSCAHSEYSASSVESFTGPIWDLQRLLVFERSVAPSAMMPVASAARRIAVTRRKSAPKPSECLPSRNATVSTVWNWRCRYNPSLPETSWPTPSMVKRTNVLHESPYIFKLSANASGSRAQVALSPAAASRHAELTLVCDSLTRASHVSREIGRTVRPSVRDWERRLNWFTATLPN